LYGYFPFNNFEYDIRPLGFFKVCQRLRRQTMAIRDKDDSEERQAFGDSSFSSYGHPW
jgi:hypothetical protein